MSVLTPLSFRGSPSAALRLPPLCSCLPPTACQASAAPESSSIPAFPVPSGEQGLYGQLWVTQLSLGLRVSGLSVLGFFFFFQN